MIQWIDVTLLPLLTGNSDYVIDWAALAIVRPDTVSLSQEIAFTAFAYLYMSICFYLFFAGLILLYTVQHDLWKIRNSVGPSWRTGLRPEAYDTDLKVIEAVFRCAMVGLLIATSMKLQTAYLSTSASNIWHWLVGDARAVVIGPDLEADWARYNAPTHYTSLVVALVVAVVFLNGVMKLASARYLRAQSTKMAMAVGVLVTAYLSIGAFTGFSILLGFGLLVAVYGIFDPGFGTRRTSVVEDDRLAP